MTPSPQKARDFLNDAITFGWSGAYQKGVDTGGSPYVTVTLLSDGGDTIRAAWHTRPTDGRSYRLSGVIHGTGTNARHITLTKAYEILGHTNHHK